MCYGMCILQKQHPYFPNLFSENDLILFLLRKPSLEIDARESDPTFPDNYFPFVVAVPLGNELSYRSSVSAMSNSSSLILSRAYFNKVFTVSFHWNRFCQNQKCLSITIYDVWLSVHLIWSISKLLNNLSLLSWHIFFLREREYCGI